MSGGTTRRELFRLGAGLLAGAAGVAPLTAVGAGAPAADRNDPPLDAAGAARAVRGWLRDPAAARALGERYLARHPEEADAEALHVLALGPGPARGARERFAERRQRDFLRGDTVALAGWRVSRSEARLCALLALA